MSLPTASGYTFGTVFSSASAIDPQLGVQLGDTFELGDGTRLQLLQASGSIAANAACTSTVVTTGSPWVVAATSATLQSVVAVNDRSGATGLVQRGTDLAGVALTTGQVAFFTVKGLCKPKIAASQTANEFLASTATAGTLTGAVAGTDPPNTIELLTSTTTAAPALSIIH
jgi:hypothetical protein